LFNNLNEIVFFSIWVRATISSTIKDGVVIDKDVMHVSMSLTLEALAYRIMCFFRNHLRLLNAKEHLTTSDNGIVTKFEQECVSRTNDQQPIVANPLLQSWNICRLD
jgi:hypothetical protein